MVRPHHRSHLAGEVHLGEHLDAGDRMTLDQLPLVRRELARLVQDVGRDDQLADVVDRRAHAEPEQLARLHAVANGQRAGKVGDALAVTLRVAVLRLDRAGPLPRDFEKLSLEARRTAVQIQHLACGRELRQDAMAAVEMDERVAQASLFADSLGVLARRFRREQQVASLDRDLLRALEMLFGRAELAASPARSSPDAARSRRARRRRATARRASVPFRTPPRRDEFPAGDLQRGDFVGAAAACEIARFARRPIPPCRRARRDGALRQGTIAQMRATSLARPKALRARAASEVRAPSPCSLTAREHAEACTTGRLREIRSSTSTAAIASLQPSSPPHARCWIWTAARRASERRFLEVARHWAGSNQVEGQPYAGSCERVADLACAL